MIIAILSRYDITTKNTATSYHSYFKIHYSIQYCEVRLAGPMLLYSKSGLNAAQRCCHLSKNTVNPAGVQAEREPRRDRISNIPQLDGSKAAVLESR